MPAPKTHTFAERYDRALRYARGTPLPECAPKPLPTCHWPKEDLEFIEQYRGWLLSGGVSAMVVNFYHLMMAGHVFGLTLKPYAELDPDRDLACALAYINAKHLSWEWTRNCKNSLKIFRRYLRLQRGLGEESKARPFDVGKHTEGLPEWIVNELEKYQRLLQRNWRMTRIDQNIRGFWSKHERMWRFFCEKRGVKEFSDLKRQFVLDYLDWRLSAGIAVRGVECELHIFHTFLLFLQEEEYSVPNSLLRIPDLKVPDSLPKHLTDEQVRKLRDEMERGVRDAKLPSHRRIALMDRAAFDLMWQGGLRLGEVEELRLEDLNLGQKCLSVCDGKNRKDRTIYLASTAIQALQEYLAVRGGGTPGSSDHVFLFRNAAVKKDLIRARLKDAGSRVGVKVNPHRLRHTCATQLLNAGCPITSIQRLLGHKKISSTMIYARAHDQTVADDYFAAMERVEQRMEIGEKKKDEVVKVQPVPPEASRQIQVLSLDQRMKLLQFADQLAQPDLCWGERLSIRSQLLLLFSVVQEHPPLK